MRRHRLDLSGWMVNIPISAAAFVLMRVLLATPLDVLVWEGLSPKTAVGAETLGEDIEIFDMV